MRSTNHAYIGERSIWGGTQPFALSTAAREQHVYVIGKTGTGKSTLLRNMLVQDIAAGVGVGLIDPHGDLSEELLDHIPGSRVRDVVYFNPADKEHPIGLNLLRLGEHGQEHLITSGLVSAFKNVWSESWGPRLEYILYCTIAALAAANNTTILGAQRMLTDAEYRAWVVRQSSDPVVRAFWEDEFAGYDKRLLAEFVAPLQNKVGQLVLSPLLRNIVGQVRSRLDFQFVMNRRRIFIANLSKGSLGEDKSSLLGSMLVTAFQLAAMGRAALAQTERYPFHLYVDEFQNFATDSFAGILSEARKYGLSLTLSHQHTGQLRESIRDAILGNIGSVLAFRVGERDAAVLAREFGEDAGSTLFTNLNNYECRVRTLLHGEPIAPFLMHTHPPQGMSYGKAKAIRERSRQAYGSPRSVVESRIARWRAHAPPVRRRNTR